MHPSLKWGLSEDEAAARVSKENRAELSSALTSVRNFLLRQPTVSFKGLSVEESAEVDGIRAVYDVVGATVPGALIQSVNELIRGIPKVTGGVDVTAERGDVPMVTVTVRMPKRQQVAPTETFSRMSPAARAKGASARRLVKHRGGVTAISKPLVSDSMPPPVATGWDREVATGRATGASGKRSGASTRKTGDAGAYAFLSFLLSKN